MAKCVSCKAGLPIGSSSRRRYCDKCIKERQIKAGQSRKGIPYQPESYRNCVNCGTTFMAKVDSERTLCNYCLKNRQVVVYKANLPKIKQAIRNDRRVREMWYTCACGTAVTWKNTRLDKAKNVMAGTETCPDCGLKTEICVPITQHCARCGEPLMARKGTKLKYCPTCTVSIKRIELITYFEGLVGVENVDSLLNQRHILIKKLQEWDRLGR